MGNNVNGRKLHIIKNMLNTKIHGKPHAWTLEEIVSRVKKAGIETSLGQIRNLLETKIIYSDGTFCSCVNRGIKAVYYREFRYVRKAN